MVYKPPVTEKRTEILQPTMILKPKEAIKAALKTPMLSFMLSKEVKEQKIFRKESKKSKKSKPRKRLGRFCKVFTNLKYLNLCNKTKSKFEFPSLFTGLLWIYSVY